MPKKATKETPPSRGRRIESLRKLALDLGAKGEGFKSLLLELQAEFGASASATLLPGDHAFDFSEQVHLSAKQRRGLEAFLPALPDFADKSNKRAQAKSRGTVFVCSEREAKTLGFSSLLLYTLAHESLTVGVLVFFRTQGKFEEQALRILDEIAGTLSLSFALRFYKNKACDAGGLANLDGLTGLFNHRYFQETISNELVKSQRFGHSVSLLLIDVDHFKQINDKFGHPRGDIVLKTLSQILRKIVRSYDVAARYGGEEFAVVLPHTDSAQALEVAERMRKAVLEQTFPGPSSKETLRLSISIGVATCPQNAKTKTELIDRADQALYLAKSEGRNRVSLSLANSSEPIRIGFCPATLKSAYYRDVLSGMEDVIREIKQIELSVHAPQKESDYEMLPLLFREFAKERLDAVAVCTQSPHAVRDLKILHKAKIPVFFFNVPEPIKDAAICSYVGYDQAEAGKTAGSYLARVLRGSGKIAIIEGLPEPTSRLRVSGFKKALTEFPEMTIVASESGEWMPRKAQKVASDLLRRHRDLDAIFAVSDSMALGAVAAVKANGLFGKIFVIGLDGTKEALAAVKDGSLTATLDTRPREMGRILLRTIVRGLMKEEPVARKINSPITIVTQENVEHSLAP
jgi:diguanylate cyclase (GGDEF)-like protein